MTFFRLTVQEKINFIQDLPLSESHTHEISDNHMFSRSRLIFMDLY